MAMTNDIGVQNLLSGQPVAPKRQVEPAREVQAAKMNQGKAFEDALASAMKSEAQPGKGELAQTVEDLNGLVQDLQRQVRFSLDDDSGEVVVTVVDRSTDDVIRQIPAEDVLQLRERLEQATGAIFKGRA